jgi:hypothetical protein
MNSVFYRTIISVQIIICLNSCAGQSPIDDCKIGINNAQRNLNNYYKSKDSTLLDTSLRYTEQSMLCKETRLRAVELKTSLLVLLRKYKRGYEFIDSLRQDDFSKEYKKRMNYSFLRALEMEANGDTTNAHKLYAEAVNYVNHFIETTGKDSQIDQDAYYDLYFIKSRIFTQEQIENELEELAKENPSDRVFFTVLKSSFKNTK